MKIIDVHSHINIMGDKAYDIIENSPHVSTILINSLDILSYERMIQFRKKYYDNGGMMKLSFSLGLYPPSELKKDFENKVIDGFDDDVDIIIDRMRLDKDILSAIGEIGLDGNANNEDFENDRIIFRKLIRLAEELKLPIIIHSRKAEKEVLEDIKDFNGDIILHTFSGKKKLAKEALLMKRVYFSIPCILSHSEQFRQLVEMVPLNRLLTETDSPFMPLRGKEYSEPKDIVETIRVISEIKGMNMEETAQVLFMNAKRIFPHV